MVMFGCTNDKESINYNQFNGNKIVEKIISKDKSDIIENFSDNSYVDKESLEDTIDKLIGMNIDKDSVKYIGNVIYSGNNIDSLNYRNFVIHISPFTKIERDIIYNIYEFKNADESYLLNISYYRAEETFIPLGINVGMVTLGGNVGHDYLEKSKRLYKEEKYLPSMKHLITAYELSSNIPNMFIGDKEDYISFKLDLERGINKSFSFPSKIDINGKNIVIMGISFGDSINEDMFIVTYNTSYSVVDNKVDIENEAKDFYKLINDYYPGLGDKENRIVMRIFDSLGEGYVIDVSSDK